MDMNDNAQSQLLKKLSEEVARKRSLGVYPPGLEQQLEYEFDEIVKRKAEDNGETVQALKNLVLDKLAVIDHLSIMVVELESRIAQLERSQKS